MLFGAHCSGGIKKALDKGADMGADAVQLFAQSPRTWRFPDHDPADLQGFRARRAELGVPALVHALYLVNLAAPDDAIYAKSVETMRATVDAACAIDAEAVVFHVGSHLGAGFEAGLERVIPAIEQVLDRCNDRTWLLVENSAGAGGTIGRSVDELAVIFDAAGRHERLGICLDSCHLFVSGVDVTDRQVLAAMLDELEARIGLDRLRALHANDAKAPLGSNRDRHDNIGAGLMGEGLGVFLAEPRLQGLPVVLEVPGADGKGPNADEIRKLRELHARAAA
ncbi:MAG TPA: deoxyribonuclease IV [Gaiellaceae bacterium]|nr:deoxyribonuclease IV [Gaiellaceae bacterium]